jgi:ABC-type lipoprotein release transport system permease subunit
MNTMLALAWRNLWRHKRRTWLTVGAMVFSNILLVFLISLQIGNYDMMIDNSLKAYSGQLQVSLKGYQDEPKMRLALEDISSLTEHIRVAMPELNVSKRAQAFVLASSDERSFGLQLAGVDVQHEASVSSIPGLVKEGRYIRSNNGSDQDFEIIIGKVLARNLKVTVGDQITLLGSGYDGSFAAAVVQVVGIFESGITEIDRGLAQIPFDAFQSVFAMQGRGHSIVANGADVKKVELYQQKLEAALSDTDGELETLNWMQLNPGLQQAIQSDMASAWFMYAVLVVLVSFSVLNTQLMSVLERTREFGIMNAIGLRPIELTKLVLLETGVMAGLGFAIGTLGGLVLAIYLNRVGISFPGMEEMAAQYNLSGTMHPSLSPFSIASGPAAVFIGCLLAAIYPVLKLQKLEPVAAMRAA